ncbi:MAG: hydantoinase B/oxoprolinase family protein [Rhodospirillales bacterium]|nr:hydantoinase B/oxoprolinase family protein [Rhodospirillales bacterium]MDE0379622.1 hydantoinase B/oxoprolinase family protein [Rhodospirillales bacterium]
MIRDPVATPILARRVDAIVREMSNALLRSARSSVIAAAKDFSCALLTHDDRLIAAAGALRRTLSRRGRWARGTASSRSP